jgi:hypothetical protein
MKNKLILMFMLSAALLSAQVPKLINYQGVARGNDGLPVLETSIGLKFEILRTSATGSVVYTETQASKTNSLGLILTQIGLNGDLSTINWQNGPYFLRVSVDFDAGTNYVALGVQQIMAVPYSMYAQTVPANYNANTNRLDVGGNSFTLNSSPATNITPAGIVSVTTTGTNSFVVSVPASSISVTSTVGAAGVGTTGVNAFNINVPPAPTTTVRGLGAAVVNPTVGSSFTVTVPQTQITQSGVAQVTSAGINTFNVHVPQTNVVATSTSGVFAFNSPGTNSFNINVPSPTLQATGLASSSSVGNLHTINVPLPTYAQSTGVLNFGTNAVNITPSVALSPLLVLSVGPLTNSVSLTSVSPWKQTVGTVTLGNLTDKVGIGTNAPVENLQLQSTGNTTASILSGNSNVSSLMFGTNASHGNGRINYDNSNNTLSLWTNGVANRLYVDANGNIGLGNTLPVSKLDVLGNLRVNTGTSVDKIMFGNVGGVNDGYSGVYGTGGSLAFAVFKSGAPATSFGSQNSHDAMFIEHTTGRVGLGTNTPGQNLSIHSPNSASLSIISATNSSQLFFGTSTNASAGRVSYDVTNNSMDFATNNTSGRLFINNNGYVGIGTTSPLSRFEVSAGGVTTPTTGQSSFYQTSNSGSALFAEANNFGTSTGATTFYSRAMLAGYIAGQTPLNPSNADVGVYGAGWGWGMLAAGGNPAVPTTYAGIAGASYAGVFMGGNVGIGTTAPTAALHVAGTTRLVDGTQGANKVLSSDAQGNATWENSSKNTGFHAYSTAGQTIGSTFSFVQVGFGAEDHDPGNNFSGNAYTCPSAGFYHFEATVSWSSIVGVGYTFVAIYKNSQPIKYRMATAAATFHSNDLSVSIPCLQGDQITVYVMQTSGTATTYAPSSQYTYFSGYRVY